jgi:hypothetical protein
MTASLISPLTRSNCPNTARYCCLPGKNNRDWGDHRCSWCWCRARHRPCTAGSSTSRGSGGKTSWSPCGGDRPSLHAKKWHRTDSRGCCHLSDKIGCFSDNLPRCQAPSADWLAHIIWRSIVGSSFPAFHYSSSPDSAPRAPKYMEKVPRNA